MPQLTPQPRIDTVVSDPASGAQRRRSDYHGTALFAGRGMVRADIQEEVRFFLPDSLPYWRGRLDDGVLACSVSLQVQSGYPNSVTGPHAAWVPDPRVDGVAWIELSFDVDARDPLAVAYRVVALCKPEAVATGAVSD